MTQWLPLIALNIFTWTLTKTETLPFPLGNNISLIFFANGSSWNILIRLSFLESIYTSRSVKYFKKIPYHLNTALSTNIVNETLKLMLCATIKHMRCCGNATALSCVRVLATWYTTELSCVRTLAAHHIDALCCPGALATRHTTAHCLVVFCLATLLLGAMQWLLSPFIMVLLYCTVLEGDEDSTKCCRAVLFLEPWPRGTQLYYALRPLF